MLELALNNTKSLFGFYILLARVIHMLPHEAEGLRKSLKLFVQSGQVINDLTGAFFDSHALQTENKLHHGWSFSGRSEATFRLGDFERAIELAETSLELLKGQDQLTEEVRLNGIIALSNWRIGKKEEGLAMMEKTITAIHQCRYATVSTLEGFGAVMEICQDMEVSCPQPSIETGIQTG